MVHVHSSGQPSSLAICGWWSCILLVWDVCKNQKYKKVIQWLAKREWLSSTPSSLPSNFAFASSGRRYVLPSIYAGCLHTKSMHMAYFPTLSNHTHPGIRHIYQICRKYVPYLHWIVYVRFLVAQASQHLPVCISVWASGERYNDFGTPLGCLAVTTHMQV